MSFLTYSIPLRVSSATGNGAINVNSGKSQWTVNLTEEIRIPLESRECTVELRSASIWNTPENIAQSFDNNQIAFDYALDSAIYIIPDGLYSIADLNAELSRQFVISGWPADLFVFLGNLATQKVIVQFNYDDIRIDFTGVNGTLRKVLGFNERLSPLGGVSVAGQTEVADTRANFDRVTSFLVGLSFLNQGIPTNNQLSNNVAEILITAQPGSIIPHEPRNPIKVNCRGLIGQPLSSFVVTITDQEGRFVDFNGQDSDYILVFEYSVQRSDLTRSRHQSLGLHMQ